jgi:hypothetical protein
MTPGVPECALSLADCSRHCVAALYLVNLARLGDGT